MRILPEPTALTRPYWEGAKAGKLMLQYCEDCGEYQFYPRIICSNCGGDNPQWREASGRGRVASYTVVRHPISAAYEAPYVVALIDLEEGPRMMSSLIEVGADAVAIGDQVVVAFKAWSEEIDMPVFRPAKT
ncbi:MAG: Zn-ribbon domain-containing OB-fold protein [Pseudomonadota bacterium]